MDIKPYETIYFESTPTYEGWVLDFHGTIWEVTSRGGADKLALELREAAQRQTK